MTKAVYWMVYDRPKTLGAAWAPQFGDTDKECVEFERDDMRYASYREDGPGMEYKIEAFDHIPSQNEIEARR